MIHRSLARVLLVVTFVCGVGFLQRPAHAAGLCGQVRVECSTGKIPASLIPAGWTTAYDVTFSTLAAQDLKSDGAKTIDGATWYVVNSANASTMYLNDGTHNGLYIRCNTNNTTNYTTTRTGPAIYVSIGWWISQALRATISDIWTCIQYSTPHIPDANYEEVDVGVFEFTQSLTYAAANMNMWYSGNGYGTVNNYTLMVSEAQSTRITGSAMSSSYNTTCIRLNSGGSVEVYAGTAIAGVYPDYSALVYLGRLSGWLPTPTEQNRLYNEGPRVWFSAVTGNTAGNTDILVEKMRLQYR